MLLSRSTSSCLFLRNIIVVSPNKRLCDVNATDLTGLWPSWATRHLHWLELGMRLKAFWWWFMAQILSERLYAILIESSCHIRYWMVSIYLISSEIIYAGILFYGRAKQVYSCWQHRRQRLHFKLASNSAPELFFLPACVDWIELMC